MIGSAYSDYTQSYFAVAVFIPYTRQRNEIRLAMMQSVTKAVAAYWSQTTA